MTTPKMSFVSESRADLALQSSDGVTFRVRRMSLQVSSDVFDGMFTVTSNETGQRDHETGLPLVKLDEKAEDLDLLLLFIVRDQDRLTPEHLGIDKAIKLIRLADKYGADLVRGHALCRLAVLAKKHPVKVAGPAIFYHDLALAQLALSFFDGDRRLVEQNTWNTTSSTWEIKRVLAGKAHRIAEIGPEWLENLSGETFQSLLALEGSVDSANGSYWREHAENLRL